MAEYTEIYIKRDSTLNWYAANPRLGLGEPGVDMTLHRFKVGNGIDKWNELPYMDDDLYKLLDKQSQEAADKAQELLKQIEANKLDADTKHNAVTTELRQTSRELNARMTAVETEQQEYEEVLTREFEETKAEVHSGLDEFNETRDRLDIRMDVIAGQTTEDTEILDARVDANYETHANLGANIRNIHSILNEEIQTSAENKSEIDEEIAALKAVDETERLSRIEADDIEKSERLAGYEEHGQEIARLSSYADDLSNNDDALQGQINANAEGLLRTVLFAQEASENARGEARRLDEEERQREEADRELQRAINAEETARKLADKTLDDYISRVDEQQTESLNQEARTRERLDSAFNTRLNQEAERITQIDAEAQSRDEELLEEISAERQERTLRDKEINANIDAEKNSRILSDSCEASERAENDTALQRQTDNLAKSSLQHSLALLGDTQKIRSLSDALDSETARRAETDSILQGNIDEVGQAASQNAADIQSVNEALDSEKISRIEAITAETQDRAENDAALQRQADNLSHASIRQSLMLLEEAEYRHSDIQNEALARKEQDNKLRQALDSEISLRVEADDVLRMEAKNALDAETTDRVSQGEVLQQQADSLSTASLRQNLMLLQEAEKRRELSQVVAAIKSPVDWSSVDSIAIPEPRCAVVNFTGINAMPTSKTIDIPAVLEFWDMQGNYFKKNILCSAQGSSSLGFVKKNVKIDLLNDDGSEFDLKIGNWVVQDGYHLKAYYTDFFRGIGVTSYKLWDEIMETKPHKAALVDVDGMNETATGTGNVSDLTLQIDTGALCHPDGFPCVVYLNGEFYGLFSWQIKKQRKNYHMDKSTVEHIHLDGTISTDTFWNGVINWTAFEIRNPNKLYTMDGKKYDGDAPRELIDETSDKYDPENKDHVRSKQVKRYIQDFVRRFGELRTSPSRTLYEQLFDWQNQRDYLVFSDVVSNRDGYAKNWQWTTYDGVKWYVNAYDLDMTFGGMFTGGYLTAPLTGHIVSGTALPTGFIPLLYKSELEARYKALRDTGIIDVEHIAAKLQDWTARIGQSNYALEYERWPNSPCLLNYNDSVDRVRKWLTVEIANMDKLYGYVPENDLITAEIISREKADRLEALKRENADSAEAMSRRNDDDALQRQIDKLADYAIRHSLNTAEEIHTCKEQDNALSEQITSLEKSSRDETTNLQEQINSVIMTMLRFALNDYEARERLREYINDIYQAVADTGNLTYMGARVASTNEVGDMLADVMAGTDTGETSTSEIPEELRDKVSTSSEVSEMLAEIFPNSNNE